MTKNATVLISWAGVETASKTLLGGIFEFESPIPQSSASAATGAQPITAIVKRQRCISAYKFFAAPETAAAVRPRNYQSQPVGKNYNSAVRYWRGNFYRTATYSELA